MARNIAKSFAKQTLVYWKPRPSGSSMQYEDPVEFKGAYIGNAQVGDGGPSDVVHAGGGTRENMVLFYMLAPEADGYVCWTKKLEDLTADGTIAMPPDQIEGTHRIKSVAEYVMPRTTTVALKNQAFIASVM